MKIHTDHRKTFSTDMVYFEFVRVSFGLKRFSADFRRMMNNVLAAINGIEAFVYLEDINFYSVSIEETQLHDSFTTL